ncbi:hypothetical protein C900_04917 [Fulvivirga imtechensis AK7]|uniref:Protein SirB1 N-terminal domain-containing protein n=1 Tax=Fulvivirga imtechensis AK7 TaxID=1237149 RepID=L8JPU7_9BACT|nr:hypothetical protein [Fulvivirga imtechensis]ELR69529.1 hypothetical protein C900_04917 [Fulvivirga imtechensis AK7]
MKKRGIIFLIISTLFNSVVLHAQNITVAKLQYHSAFEQEVIQSYLEDQSVDMLTLQLITDKAVVKEEIDKYREVFNEFIAVLAKKKGKYDNDQRFLSHLFYKTHQKFLKKYNSFSTLRSVFTNGEYDCLSASALYALMLDALDIGYLVVETNYHIYLQIDIEDRVVLFESTDPLNGFINDSKEIEKRLSEYDAGNYRLTASNKNTYEYVSKINNEVGLSHIVGLHYYNAAVAAYNEQLLKEAVDNLEKTILFYNSERVIEFGAVIARALLADAMNIEDKKEQLARVNNILKLQPALVSGY